MDIIFSRLYKIDVHSESIAPLTLPNTHNDLSGYITQLMEDIADDSESRDFLFSSDTTEVRALINNAIVKSEYDSTTKRIGDRLLEKEIDAQKYLKDRKLKAEIPAGMLIISVINVAEGVKKVFISKAEYSEFIDSITYKKSQGPPTKKKIYKAFTFDIDENSDVGNVAIYDTGNLAKYWWKDFLELSEVRSDEANTKDAFQVIDTKILTPIKSLSRVDHIHLRNSTIRYFRATPEFKIEEFITNAIGDYEPYDSTVDINAIKEKLREAPKKYKFDARFEIIKKLITAHFINDIPLTNQIDLRLKEDINNIGSVIFPMTHKGKKCVVIESEKGYEYFGGEKREK